MDNQVMEIAQAFVKSWEVKGGIFPLVSLIMAGAGVILFLIALLAYWKYVQPDKDNREGLQFVCIAVGLVGAVTFIIFGLVGAHGWHQYLVWLKDPHVFALQKLIQALRY